MGLRRGFLGCCTASTLRIGSYMANPRILIRDEFSVSRWNSLCQFGFRHPVNTHCIGPVLVLIGLRFRTVSRNGIGFATSNCTGTSRMLRYFVSRPVDLEQPVSDDFQTKHQPTKPERKMERSAYYVFDYVGHIPAQVSCFLEQITNEVDLAGPRLSPSSGRPRVFLAHRAGPAKVKIQKIVKGEGSNVPPYKLKRIVRLWLNIHAYDMSFGPGLVQSHCSPASATAKVEHSLRNGHAWPSFACGVSVASMGRKFPRAALP